jgi:D-beta-D-heptose 7-phosphate kinase/D-beta-D-heptose 1-phosphate adenosyltransferase
VLDRATRKSRMTQQTHLMSDETVALVARRGFCDTTILVVGDLMIDKYIHGDVNRISPEAPVPVLSVRGERNVAGGAANVALNTAGLHAKTIIAGVIGDDPAGEELLKLLGRSGVCDAGVIRDRSRPTTRKTRVVCGNHQIVRLDEEVTEDISEATAFELLGKIIRLLEQVDAVILSDYGKGVLAQHLPQAIISECRRRNTPVLVDPKRHDYSAYRGATCITPNLKEFQHALELLGLRHEPLDTSAPKLRRYLRCESLLVTQGADGMTLVTDKSLVHLPAMAEEVFDVSGAGDTVIATMSTALAAGLPLQSTIELANAAASIVVRHSGTAPINWLDLYDLIQNQNARAGLPKSKPVRIPPARFTAAGAV